MEKKDLVELLNEIFIPLGFKRKGNKWTSNGEVLSKMIDLQRSYYSKSYYINYGYIINGLELTTMTHLYYRLGGNDKNEQKRITDLLDLENNIPINQRLVELRNFIVNNIAKKIVVVNTEEDLLGEIKKLPYSSMVPFIVKKHFNLHDPNVSPDL